MNELEVRLRDELRAAAGDAVVPPHLVPAAARSARRIRRRRTAAGGTLGAAALAAGIAGPAQRAADRPGRWTAAPATTAPAAGVPDLLVAIVHTGCRDTAQGPGSTCYRTELRYTPPVSPAPPFWVEEGGPGTRPVEVPGEVLVRFSDGTVARERVTRTGDREWTAAFDVPDGAEVDSIQIVAEEPGELSAEPTPSG